MGHTNGHDCKRVLLSDYVEKGRKFKAKGLVEGVQDVMKDYSLMDCVG